MGSTQIRTVPAVAILAGALWAAVLVGCRAADQSSMAVSNHALSGVVKSVDATRLVITRSGTHAGEMTFVLIPTTHREGPIGAGTTVQVRYRQDGRNQIATAILAIGSKPTALPLAAP